MQEYDQGKWKGEYPDERQRDVLVRSIVQEDLKENQYREDDDEAVGEEGEAGFRDESPFVQPGFPVGTIFVGARGI